MKVKGDRNQALSLIWKLKHHRYGQARSQEFAMGGVVSEVWGRSPQPPEAGGKAPSRRRQGVWGQSPQRSEILRFFNKNLGIFRHFRLKFLL